MLQNRIRQLHWVTPEHLEACIMLSAPEVAAELENAQEELITMDAKRAPQDKLACVVACSKSVFLILQKSVRIQQGAEISASADDFLPALIYVLIKANPPLLHSNIEVCPLNGVCWFASLQKSFLFFFSSTFANHSHRAVYQSLLQSGALDGRRGRLLFHQPHGCPHLCAEPEC